MEAAPVLPWGPLAMREREGRKGGGRGALFGLHNKMHTFVNSLL